MMIEEYRSSIIWEVKGVHKQHHLSEILAALSPLAEEPKTQGRESIIDIV